MFSLLQSGPKHDLSAWRVTIPEIASLPEPENPKKFYHTFSVEVRRVDVLESKWLLLVDPIHLYICTSIIGSVSCILKYICQMTLKHLTGQLRESTMSSMCWTKSYESSMVSPSSLHVYLTRSDTVSNNRCIIFITLMCVNILQSSHHMLCSWWFASNVATREKSYNIWNWLNYLVLYFVWPDIL